MNTDNNQKEYFEKHAQKWVKFTGHKLPSILIYLGVFTRIVFILLFSSGAYHAMSTGGANFIQIWAVTLIIPAVVELTLSALTLATSRLWATHFYFAVFFMACILGGGVFNAVKLNSFLSGLKLSETALLSLWITLQTSNFLAVVALEAAGLLIAIQLGWIKNIGTIAGNAFEPESLEIDQVPTGENLPQHEYNNFKNILLVKSDIRDLVAKATFEKPNTIETVGGEISINKVPVSIAKLKQRIATNQSYILKGTKGRNPETCAGNIAAALFVLDELEGFAQNQTKSYNEALKEHDFKNGV